MTRNNTYQDTKKLEERPVRRHRLINSQRSNHETHRKNEIRVSLEEKQALASLAKQEGESVSGLIRTLVEKYMTLNATTTIRKLPKWKIAVGLITAAFFGHLLTLIPMHNHGHKHKVTVSAAPLNLVHDAGVKGAFDAEIENQTNSSTHFGNSIK